jgi:hypothetical protein
MHCNLTVCVVVIWTGANGGTLGKSRESSGTMKGMNFFDQTRDYQLLKKNCAVRSFLVQM